jgi:parallel beta-helix repeat protein
MNSTVENNLLISSGTVSLYYTKYIKVENNTFIDSKGIKLVGGDIDYWATHIIENNIMNDKPIYYYRDASGVVVPSNAAEIILVNCTNFIISHIIFSKGGGIQLGYSSSNIICWNTIEGETNSGICLYASSHNNLSYNTLTNCMDGIEIIEYSSDNEIYRNIIINNSYFGIYLDTDSSNNWIYQNIIKNNCNGILSAGKSNQCSQNSIENNENKGILCTGKSNLCSENYIANNTYGVYLSYSSNTTIRRNNFVNNKIHVFFNADYTIEYSNKWENNFYSPQKERFIKIIFGRVQTRFYHWEGPSHGQYKVYIYRPGFNVDWRPAQEPYDISGMR